MSENLTPEVREDLKAKALKASNGPWTREGDGARALLRDAGLMILAVRHRIPAALHEANFDFIAAANPSTILAYEAALEEAEARIEDLTNKLDDERENYGNAEAEAKDDAATIAAMVKALTDPRGEPEDYDPWPIQRAEDLMRAYLANQAALSALQQENERLREAVRPFLPITIRENQDYAEVTFGEHQTQAMTMAPADWLALNKAFASPEVGAEIKPVTMLVGQDWLSRHAATDPDTSVEAGPDVLAWLSENRNVELSFDYGDADDDGKGWCVHRVNGGVNDREWTLIGTGETPLSALRAALQRKGEAG